MFKKPVRIKSSNRMKGSERKRLKQNVLTQFRNITEDQLSMLMPNKEDIFITKIETQNGTFLTCYCMGKNPLFFEVDKEKVLYPTVYTLWQLVESIPYMVTWPPVFEKISRGADLMLPGVVIPYGGFENIERGEIIGVRLAGNKAIVAVGTAAVSSKDISETGMKGKGISICHWYMDSLWSMGDSAEIPLIPDPLPANTDATYQDDFALNMETVVSLLQEAATDAPQEEAENSALNSDNQTVKCGSEEAQQDDLIQNSENLEEDIKLQDTDTLNDESSPEHCMSNIDTAESRQTDDQNDTSPTCLSPEEEMDLLLENCFLQALIDAKKAEFPMLVSAFSAQYLHAACPEGQKIDIKKSRYKKMGKFLQDMEKKQLIKIGELSKGVLSIIEINVQNESIREFKSSDFAKERSSAKAEALARKDAEDSQEGINVIEMYAVSGNTRSFFKLFDCSKGQAFTSAEVRKMLTNYVKENELVSKSNKRLVTLDPVLSDVLFDKNFREDSVAWDVLLGRFLEKMNPCHKVAANGRESAIRKGKMEPIEVKLEQRMGNKKVTLVKNLEQFGVDPNEFAHRIQLAAASSTTVSQLPGKTASGLQVLIQGNQSSHVSKLLEELAIPKKYITGLDKMKSKGKKR